MNEWRRISAEADGIRKKIIGWIFTLMVVDVCSQGWTVDQEKRWMREWKEEGGGKRGWKRRRMYF